MTLDSVVPPNLVSIANFWPQARDGFNDLFRACAAQRRCRAQHPGLAGVFTGLVRRLESRPITTKVAAAPGGPSVNVVLDGGALVNWLAAVAFQTPTYRNVPRWIGELAAGRPRSIGVSRIGEVTPSGFTGYGLTYGVSCSEWVPYERASGILSAGRRAFPRYPATVLAQAPQFAYITDDCRVWNVPKASTAQRTVTRSTIPTVILGGTFDAVTSVASGRSRRRPSGSAPPSGLRALHRLRHPGGVLHGLAPRLGRPAAKKNSRRPSRLV